MVIKYLSTEDKHSRVLWDKRCHQGITLGSQTEAQMLPSSGMMSCLNQARTLPILVVWDSHLLRFVYLGLWRPNNVFHCCYPIFKQNLKACIFHVLKNHHISLTSTIDESLNLKLSLYQLSKSTCSVIFWKSTEDEHQRTVVENCKQNQILSKSDNYAPSLIHLSQKSIIQS